MDHFDAGDTKGRLIEAAGQVFSEKGFKAATVRDICRLAKANVAAVHYHFGDKAGLYKTLLSEAFEIGLRRYPPDMGLDPEAPAEERLFAFVHSFLLRSLPCGPHSWCGRLMSMELLEPTPALDYMVTRYIMPLSERLRKIVVEILDDGTGQDDERAFQCAMSIVGQCQHISRNRAVMDKLSPGLRMDAEGIEGLARHITDFSIAALKNLPGLRKRA